MGHDLAESVGDKVCDAQHAFEKVVNGTTVEARFKQYRASIPLGYPTLDDLYPEPG